MSQVHYILYRLFEAINKLISSPFWKYLCNPSTWPRLSPNLVLSPGLILTPRVYFPVTSTATRREKIRKKSGPHP